MPQGRVTFCDRGLAYMRGHQLILKICPICSQHNEPRAAEKGLCAWCAYVPEPADIRAVAELDVAQEAT